MTEALPFNLVCRHRLNLVCPAWRDALKDSQQVWELLTVDPRRATAPARRRRRERLPSRAALEAFVAGYGGHVRAVKLSHLNGKAKDAGCASPSNLAKAIAQLLPLLESLSLDRCGTRYITAALRLLRRTPKLASLSLNLCRSQCLEAWEEWEEVRSLPPRRPTLLPLALFAWDHPAAAIVLSRRLS